MMKGKKVVSWMLAAAMVIPQLSGCSTPSSAPGQPTKALQETVDSTLAASSVRDFSKDDGSALTVAEGKGKIAVADQKLTITSEKDDATIVLDEQTAPFHNGEVEFVFNPHNDNDGGLYGVVLRYADDGSWTFVGQEGVSAKDPYLTSWVMRTSDGKRELLCTDGQRIYAGRQKPYTLKARLEDNALTLYLDNAMIYSGETGGVTQGTGRAGLLYANGSGADIINLSVSECTPLAPVLTEGEEKQISSDELTVTLDSAFPRVLRYKLKSGENTLSGQEKPYYVVEINNTRYVPQVTGDFTGDSASYHLTVKEIGVSFDAGYTVKDNVLRMELSNIEDQDNFVKTINFPGQSMVSMRNDLPGAELRVNDYRRETICSLAGTWAQRACQTTSLAVLSGGGIAAAINNGNINNRREIAYQTVMQDGYYTTGLWTNEFQYRGLDDLPLDTLWAEVAVTGDRNGDGAVDYQDAAIARRDDIGTERLGSDVYQNSMSMIAMDVGSIAQYPFLRILDNIKKFHAGTDGFNQMILIKGYQSEGHDASHPDFANVSQRAGGIEDLKVLLDEAGKYSAGIGLHINHTEAYPEAKQYSEDLVSDTPGWSWYDDSYHIIRENDILNQEDGLEKRLDDLNDMTDGKLSMIYVDTYQDSRWQCDKVAKKIHDLGWMLGTEYSEEMLKYSTWSHTINSKRLEYNTQGNLVRFIDNQNKDIFGSSPLFRGLVNRNLNAGFDGWQKCFSYDATIENFYTQVLPQRYLAHFPVNEWPEENKVLLGGDSQVTTTYADGVNRITKDGRDVAVGNMIFIPWDPEQETKIYHWNEAGGDSTWQLPESWEDQTEVKLFTLTDEGRTQEKVIPAANHQVTVTAKAKTGYVLYKGTDPVTKTDLTTYAWGEGSPVRDMGFDSHTFGYAWEKSSTDGRTDHITFRDNAARPAADDPSPEAVSAAANRDMADNQNGNTHIHVEGGRDAVLTQTMENLVPGQSYSASAFMEASDGRVLSISVTTPDGKTVSNETNDYSLPYGAPHNDRLGSAYQRVKLAFTQPEGGTTAVLTLTAQADGQEDAFANFDNVRVTPVSISDDQGHTYFEDFENVDQEFGPFVCPTRVEQDHLSERNGEWTKDVIDGRYSLKIRGEGDVEARPNYLRTVSHRLRLLPNTTYTVGMDYMVTDMPNNTEVLEDGVPAFVVNVRSDQAALAGDSAQALLASRPCTADDSEPRHMEPITFTTGAYDDYYVELSDETFAHEFIIDNFYADQQ